MGDWGSGAFQNDVALDLLGDLVDWVVGVVERDLDSMDTNSGRGQLHRPVVAAVATLGALLSEIPSARNCLERSQVLIWRDRYLRWFEAVFVSSAPADFADAVREVALREFERLLGLAYEEE